MKSVLYFSTSFLTFFLHLLCCALPLFTAFLGFGGYISALKWMADYRVLLLVIQVGLLGFTFYWLYFRSRASRYLRLEKVFFWVMLALSVGAWALPHGWLQTEQQQLATQQVKRVFATRELQLNVGKQKIEIPLENVVGVLRAERQDNIVSVKYNFNQTNPTMILKELSRLGFSVQIQENQ